MNEWYSQIMYTNIFPTIYSPRCGWISKYPYSQVSIIIYYCKITEILLFKYKSIRKFLLLFFLFTKIFTFVSFSLLLSYFYLLVNEKNIAFLISEP